jgi:hypothetical protein
MVSPVITGVTSSTWPITIAAGVNSSSNLPNGPALEIKTKTKRPMATVGTL